MTRTVAIVVAISLATVASVGLRAQRQYALFASVVDSTSGEPIDTLVADQIEVREDNVACRIVRMERTDWPVRVELLIDNGVGVGSANLIHLRNGLRAFVEQLPAGVEATIITTAPQPRTLVAPTTNRQALLRGAGLLTPDDAAGRFVDALIEAATRIEKAQGRKDAGNFFPVVVALASSALEGSMIVERDIERLLLRYQLNGTTAHVIMLSSVASSANGDALPARMGLAITQATRGRYENIAAPSRIATLLPEIAQLIAKSDMRQRKQFRITFERPKDKSGPLEKVTVAGPSNLTMQLSVDGRLP